MITRENIRDIVKGMDHDTKMTILNSTKEYIHIECGVWGVKAEPTDDNDGTIFERISSEEWSGEEYLIPTPEIHEYIRETSVGKDCDFEVFLRSEPHNKRRIHDNVTYWMLTPEEVNALFTQFKNLKSGSLVLIKLDPGYMVFSNEVTNMQGVYSSAKVISTFEEFREALGIKEG